MTFSADGDGDINLLDLATKEKELSRCPKINRVTALAIATFPPVATVRKLEICHPRQGPLRFQEGSAELWLRLPDP
jgi:hypothetical protein